MFLNTVKKTPPLTFSIIVLGADPKHEVPNANVIETLPLTYCDETTYNFTWGWMVFVYVMTVPTICLLCCIGCGVGGLAVMLGLEATEG